MFRVYCPVCGSKIYENEEEKPLRVILRSYNDLCPNCNAALKPEPFKVVVTSKK
jgi:NAD-dependent SIR2 family protein deacetylase